MLERHYREILGHFSRKLGDRDVARDIVQESYLRVIAKLGGASVLTADIRALLFRTGTNVLIDQLRRQKVEDDTFRTLALVRPDEAPSQEDAASAAQQAARTMRALERLPRMRREVFILVRVHGYSHAEVSEHLGISVAAVEKHMFRAVIDTAP